MSCLEVSASLGPTDSWLTIASGPRKRLMRAIGLLRDALSYARLAGREEWDFAVEIPAFLRQGVTENDLRWLVCCGYANCAEERLAGAGEFDRRFCHRSVLLFSRKTCFTLTTAGLAFAERVVLRDDRVPPAAGHPEILVIEPPRPSWDVQRKELSLQGKLVKEYKVPSPNQVTILSAFEEDGWPLRIDDPLPRVAGMCPKRRLHDAIINLNRNQKQASLRFMGDGTGEGVRWEAVVFTNGVKG